MYQYTLSAQSNTLRSKFNDCYSYMKLASKFIYLLDGRQSDKNERITVSVLGLPVEGGGPCNGKVMQRLVKSASCSRHPNRGNCIPATVVSSRPHTATLKGNTVLDQQQKVRGQEATTKWV